MCYCQIIILLSNLFSCSQYGGYWTFASGTDVVDKYLDLAFKTKDKTEWVKQALLFVGFDSATANNPGKQQLVVFDQKLMDDQWMAGVPNGAHGRKSLRPMWTDGDGESIFQYLGKTFQVCVNPGKGNGDTVTDSTMCEDRLVPIPEEAETGITTENWLTITGCDSYGGGQYYPEPKPMTYEECIAKCPDSEVYCKYSDAMTPISYSSVIECIDYYLANYELVSGHEAVILARVFFEKCLSFNPLFTGLGYGWNHQTQNITGTEWLVRGDVALSNIGAAEPFPLWN